MSDDRDALVAVLKESWHGCVVYGYTLQVQFERFADAIIAAGYRSTPAPEPVGAGWCELLKAYAGGTWTL